MPAGGNELERRCAECGRDPRDDENTADEWRAYLDVNDDLPGLRRARVRRGRLARL